MDTSLFSLTGHHPKAVSVDSQDSEVSQLSVASQDLEPNQDSEDSQHTVNLKEASAASLRVVSVDSHKDSGDNPRVALVASLKVDSEVSLKDSVDNHKDSSVASHKDSSAASHKDSGDNLRAVSASLDSLILLKVVLLPGADKPITSCLENS